MKKSLIIVFTLTVGLILMLTYDLFHLCSRYLYLSFEIGVLLLSLMAYFAAFDKARWNDPPLKNRQYSTVELEEVLATHWRGLWRFDRDPGRYLDRGTGTHQC